MIKLENELGTFIGDDEKAVAKMVAKAKREKKKKDKIDQANFDKALDKARIHGFNILSRTAVGQKASGFVLEPGDDRLSVVTKFRPHTGRDVEMATYSGDYGSRDKGEVPHYGFHVLAMVLSSSGATLAVLLQDVDNDHSVEAYTVGVHADQIAMLHLPGVTLESFK